MRKRRSRWRADGGWNSSNSDDGTRGDGTRGDGRARHTHARMVRRLGVGQKGRRRLCGRVRSHKRSQPGRLMELTTRRAACARARSRSICARAQHGRAQRDDSSGGRPSRARAA
eukprot:6245506-Prymnesium_polylepis.1